MCYLIIRFLQFYTILKKEAYSMIVHTFVFKFQTLKNNISYSRTHTLSSFIPLQFYSNRLLYYILLHFSRPCHAFIFYYVRIFIHFIAIFICFPFFFTVFFYISIQFIFLGIPIYIVSFIFVHSFLYFHLFLFFLFFQSMYLSSLH